MKLKPIDYLLIGVFCILVLAFVAFCMYICLLTYDNELTEQTKYVNEQLSK